MNKSLLDIIESSMTSSYSEFRDTIERISESASIDKSKAFKNINDIQKYLDDNRVSHLEIKSQDNKNSETLKVELLFPNIDKDIKNSFNLIIADAHVKHGNFFMDSFFEMNDSNMTKFSGMSVENTDGAVKVERIVEKSDYKRIYNIYKGISLDYIKKYEPRSYFLFNRIVEIEGGISTLCVYYDHSIRSFVYRYNPKFILSTVIEEFLSKRQDYVSLESCYIYTLSYMILHEMMHIISSNVVVGSGNESINKYVSTDDHKVVNIIQDGYINSYISALFSDISILKEKDFLFVPRHRGLYNTYAPTLSNGIGSSVQFRSEINGNGFKNYKNSKEFADVLTKKVAEIFSRNIQDITSSDINNSFIEDFDLTDYWGKEFFVNIYVNPNSLVLRSSSFMYQELIDDIMTSLTEDNYHSADSGMTKNEYQRALSNIKPGTVVRIKSTDEICIVMSFDEDSMMFDLNRAEISGVKESIDSKGNKIFSYTFSSTEEYYGKVHPYEFEIVEENSEYNSWTDSPKEERETLTKEEKETANDTPNNIIDLLTEKMGNKLDVIKIMNSMQQLIENSQVPMKETEELYNKCVGVSNSECRNSLGEELFNLLSDYFNNNFVSNEDNDFDNSQTDQKSISIGDIVYIKSKNKFGRVMSVDDKGMFTLKEVVEGIPEIVDANKEV